MVKITTKKLEKSEVEILGTIEVAEFEKHENKALTHIGERLELQGFRKGKAPADVVKKSVGEMELLEEMAELAINEAYPKILEENKIDAIGRPQITITKIGKGSDLEFKIITAILPKLDLPDYKKIAKTEIAKEEFKKEIKIEEAEVDKTILELRKMKAEQSRPPHKHEEGEDPKKHEEAHKEIPESEYPEFNDDFAKSFGNFKTAEEFKKKIKDNLKTEKETEQKDKLRLSIIEEIIKETKGDIPEVLIEGESDKILYRLQADIANMGLKFEDYLKQIGKTEDGLRKEWRTDAEKRAKLQMIIRTISQKENLKATEKEIKDDLDRLVKMYKDADPVRARAYVEQMLENEKVLKFLEEQK